MVFSVIEASMPNINLYKHPFKSEKNTLFISGKNLAEIMSEVKLKVLMPASIRLFVNDLLVPKDNWLYFIPSENDIITIKVVPEGGGGGDKNPLRTILTIAVVAASLYVTGGGAAGTFGASFGAGTMGAALLGVGVSYMGMMLVDAIAPLPSPASTTTGAQIDTGSQSFGIEGARNRFLPYGPIPVVLGIHRFAPPYAANPYTELVGNDQFLRLLFCAGYGKVDISEMRIGETAVETYLGDGVPADRLEIYVHQDFDPSVDKLKVFPSEVKELPLDVALTQAIGWITRTTEPDTNQISIDVAAKRGMVGYNPVSGTKSEQAVEYEVQYAPTGTSNWSIGNTGKTFPLRTYTGDAPIVVDVNACAGWESTEGICTSSFTGGFYTKIGLHKETGELVVVTNVTLAYCTLPAYAAPICSYLTGVNAVTGAQTGITQLVDLRDDELLSSAPGDFAPSVNDPVLRKIDIAAGTIVSRHFITGKEAALIRDNTVFDVTKGQYDVRVRRITPDNTDSNIFNDITWTALRSFNLDSPPVTESGYTLIEMRIKATNQLNGVIDTFNCVASTRMRSWDSGSQVWVDDSVTNNPGALARYTLQGAPNNRPLADARLDLSTFEEFSEYCEDKGITYNRPIDFQTSVWEQVRDILAAGRASISYKDGLWAITIDRAQTIPVQVFSPRNSFGFSFEKRFFTVPHAFRVRFPNQNKDYRTDERVVYADGFDEGSATIIEELQMPGCTDPETALQNAHFHLAQLTLRPEIYKWSADFENLVCTRGDLVLLNHDVLLVGLAAGRVKAVTDNGTHITSVTLDEEVTFEVSKEYGLTVRKDDLTVYSGKVFGTGTTTELQLSEAVLIADGPEVGDLGLFGEFGSESIEVLVTRVENADDLKATIHGVPYSAALYNDVTGAPAFDSQINIPSGLYSPALAAVRSDESVQDFGVSGEYIPRILIDFAISSVVDTDRVQQIEGQYKAQGSSTWSSLPLMDRGTTQIEITNLEELEVYDLRFRYHYTDGQSGPWAEVTHQLIGSSSDPSDVEDFSMNIVNSLMYLTWKAVADRDLSHYELRYNADLIAPTWEASSVLVDRISRFSTNISLPLRSGSYLIKAVDFGGRKSSTEASILATGVEITGVNVVELVEEDPTFSGTHDNTVVTVGDKLELDNNALMSSYALMSDIESFRTDGDFFSEGTYTFFNAVDLGEVYTSRLTPLVMAEGVNYEELMSTWILMSEIELMSSALVSGWSIEMQVRTTDDDPSGAPTWSTWGTLVVGDYTARAFQFRVILRTEQEVITPSISELAVEVDMPDRVDGDDDIISDAGGTNILFDPAFKAKPAITVTGDNLATGDYPVITAKSRTGFTIQFKASGGAGVSRQFDWIAKGYGRVTS
jgi:hypothetical protein